MKVFIVMESEHHSDNIVEVFEDKNDAQSFLDKRAYSEHVYYLCEHEVVPASGSKEPTATTFYKIKHKASGLFYRPAGTKTSNLSKVGKSYSQKPSLKMIQGLHITKKQNDEIFGGAGMLMRYSTLYYVGCNTTDFEVVEYKTS
jgi:hypothetical protein